MCPERGPLADGRRLRRLEMRERERRQGFVFLRELRERRNGRNQLGPEQRQSLLHENEIGIVPDVAARGAEMDDPAGLRALYAVRVDVRHDVVADFPFTGFGDLVIDVAHMGPQFFQLLVRDRQAQRLLALRERDPEPPPGRELPVRRKKRLHFL